MRAPCTVHSVLMIISSNFQKTPGNYGTSVRRYVHKKLPPSKYTNPPFFLERPMMDCDYAQGCPFLVSLKYFLDITNIKIYSYFYIHITPAHPLANRTVNCSPFLLLEVNVQRETLRSLEKENEASHQAI